jgi:hypothetical protein
MKDFKDFKVIMYSTAYNEERLLPFKDEYCKKEEIELYIIDNMSSDKTNKILKERNIRHHLFDTNGSFHLDKLRVEIQKQIHIDKPDWVIYSGVDMFFLHKDKTIKQLLYDIDKSGFNKAAFPQKTFYHTNELILDESENPFNKFFLYKDRGKYEFISKYDKNLQITIDHVKVPNPKIFSDNSSFIFEMHAHKLIKERTETYKRRKKAWTEGLHKSYGTHYDKLSKTNFLINSSECVDIRRNAVEYDVYKKLGLLKIN